MFVRRDGVLSNQPAALSSSESGTAEGERGAQRYRLSQLRFRAKRREAAASDTSSLLATAWKPDPRMRSP